MADANQGTIEEDAAPMQAVESSSQGKHREPSEDEVSQDGGSIMRRLHAHAIMTQKIHASFTLPERTSTHPLLPLHLIALSQIRSIRLSNNSRKSVL